MATNGIFFRDVAIRTIRLRTYGEGCGRTSGPVLKTWTDRTADLRMPPNNPRHGTIFRAPRAVVAFLQPKP